MDESLHNQIVALLNLGDASHEEQEAAIGAVMVIAESRVARLVPELLSEVQLEEFEALTAARMDVASWLSEQVPYHTQLLNAAILDVVEEATIS
jgi:hypothetical protein